MAWWGGLEIFVKLHSKLANPTELQLDGAENDFVFHCHKKEEGRKEGSTTILTTIFFVASLKIPTLARS